ncbi:hypothetical protein MKQ68_10410 [Chitinophaga horti]|uniref:Uncharacterized protein n=1 Tax=Chitinophaga horti TaxID=2920382 RepID=A0ABY6JAC4_9BACT|nr:hypothetical protein [Chitinophaga horti]UYQ95512.1 hypothetical protein MKQ68_10410 [Chitinophaga horti]
MEGLKITNGFNRNILVVFEPVGDIFALPPGEILRILPYEKDAGVGSDWVNVEYKFDVDGSPSIVIWAETHKFSAFYQGQQVNFM